MSDRATGVGSRPGLCSWIELPDGRSLDLWQAGPPDGEPLAFHFAEHGHLTLIVDSFGRILDELVAGGG